jgi:hypothetical protein
MRMPVNCISFTRPKALLVLLDRSVWAQLASVAYGRNHLRIPP